MNRASRSSSYSAFYNALRSHARLTGCVFLAAREVVEDRRNGSKFVLPDDVDQDRLRKWTPGT